MVKYKVLCLAPCLLAMGLLAVAQVPETAAPKSGQATPPPKTDKPAEAPHKRVRLEPAFKKYIDMRLVLPAFHARDSVLLTDMTLQLAFAESVLERQHKGFTAKDMAALALATATDTGDKASLERLAKFAAKTNDSQLASRISVAKLEASKTRAELPPILVPLASIDNDVIEYFQDVTGGIEAAKILGARPQLEKIIRELERQKSLPDELRARAIYLATEALKTSPVGTTPSAAGLAIEKMLRVGSRRAADDDDEDEDHDQGGDDEEQDGGDMQFQAHNGRSDANDDEDEEGDDQDRSPGQVGDDDDRDVVPPPDFKPQFFPTPKKPKKKKKATPPPPPPKNAVDFNTGVEVNNTNKAIPTKSLYRRDIWLQPGNGICRNLTCQQSQHRKNHPHCVGN